MVSLSSAAVAITILVARGRNRPWKLLFPADDFERLDAAHYGHEYIHADEIVGVAAIECPAVSQHCFVSVHTAMDIRVAGQDLLQNDPGD